MSSPRPFNLVRWFSLLSFGTLAACALATALLLSKFVEDRLLSLDATTASDFVQSVTRAENAEVLAFDPAAGGPVPQGLAEYFSHVAQMPEVVRTNVYGRDGRASRISSAEGSRRTTSSTTRSRARSSRCSLSCRGKAVAREIR
jgi:hypothetical protein